MADKVAVLTRASWKAITGGPRDTNWLEHIAGWALVVVVALLVTQLGFL